MLILTPSRITEVFLCKDGDAALTLKVTRVHDSFTYHLIFVILAALLEHLVNEGSLTVVNVSNDSNISEVFSDHCYVRLFSFMAFKIYTDIIISQFSHIEKVFLNFVKKKLLVICIKYCAVLTKVPRNDINNKKEKIRRIS